MGTPSHRRSHERRDGVWRKSGQQRQCGSRATPGVLCEPPSRVGSLGRARVFCTSQICRLGYICELDRCVVASGGTVEVFVPSTTPPPLRSSPAVLRWTSAHQPSESNFHPPVADALEDIIHLTDVEFDSYLASSQGGLPAPPGPLGLPKLQWNPLKNESLPGSITGIGVETNLERSHQGNKEVYDRGWIWSPPMRATLHRLTSTRKRASNSNTRLQQEQSARLWGDCGHTISPPPIHNTLNNEYEEEGSKSKTALLYPRETVASSNTRLQQEQSARLWGDCGHTISPPPIHNTLNNEYEEEGIKIQDGTTLQKRDKRGEFQYETTTRTKCEALE
ncbi:hypothetical protein J6590_024307 [Homalodisca vitripennis]|nr:hypothetical protein J6590_024307 [Homalodisca vitripennis]